MTAISDIDTARTPAAVSLPERYNAAVDFIDRNIASGYSERIAVIDDGLGGGLENITEGAHAPDVLDVGLRLDR